MAVEVRQSIFFSLENVEDKCKKKKSFETEVFLKRKIGWSP